MLFHDFMDFLVLHLLNSYRLIGNISVLTKVPFLLPDKLPLEDGFDATFLILLSGSTTLLIYG